MGRSKGISAAQRRTLARLSELAALRAFYLAGGTAIAAHLGHRRSLDLDIFSRFPKADLDRARDAILETAGDAAVISSTGAAVRLLVDGAPVDLVCYPYAPLVSPTAGPGDFPLASLLDLATMKLSAIARRGLRRDFWDLHAIVIDGGIPLESAARAYVKRFGVKESDLYAVLRSLTYYVDAEADVLWPAGLSPRRWAKIRAYFEKNAPALL